MVSKFMQANVKKNEIEPLFFANKHIYLNSVSNLNQGEEFSSVWFILHICFQKRYFDSFDIIQLLDINLSKIRDVARFTWLVSK